MRSYPSFVLGLTVVQISTEIRGRISKCDVSHPGCGLTTSALCMKQQTNLHILPCTLRKYSTAAVN